MARIKSALEIALENTRDIEANKEALEANQFNTEGRKLVSRFLAEPETDLAGELKKFEGRKLQWVREGAMNALLQNLVLPVDELALKTGRRVREGFSALIQDAKKLSRLMSQLEQFLAEHLEERRRVQAALEQQYAPRLRQKEAELSKQMGAPIRIDPLQDPEFVQLLKQNLVMLEDRYSRVLADVKAELRRMAGLPAIQG